MGSALPKVPHPFPCLLSIFIIFGATSQNYETSGQKIKVKHTFRHISAGERWWTSIYTRINEMKTNSIVPKQVTTHADDCIIRRFQTYVALVCSGCFLSSVAISAGRRIIIWWGCVGTHCYVLGAFNIVIQHQNITPTSSAKTYVVLRMRRFGKGSKAMGNYIILLSPLKNKTK